jgi:hypothetical protein
MSISVFYAMVNTKNALHSQPVQLRHSDGDDGRWNVAHRLMKQVVCLSLEGVALTVAIMVVVQLSYPPSTSLPQTRIAGTDFGYKSQTQITTDITALQQQKMRIITASQTLEYAPKDLGINLTATEDARKAVSYDWWQRLLPFSLILQQRNIPYYGFSVDEAKARQFADSLKKYDTAPVNAAVQFEGSRAVVIRQQDGRSYDTSHIVKSIKDLRLTNSMSVTLQPTITKPDITSDMAVRKY